ncbi:MAG: DUF11 domain-containing protein, partial [Verrucomicrobiaceae bacterium]
SRTVRFNAVISSGLNSAPDGSILNFLVRDNSRGACVSRPLIIQSLPSGDVKLSTNSGTVAPGEIFGYTISYRNQGTVTIPGAMLRLPVPKGATFVSADSGGVTEDGAVIWVLGDLAASRTGHVHVRFSAPAVSSPAMQLEARLLDATGQTVTQASDLKSMASAPVFSYTVTTQSDTVRPGERVPFTVTVTNLTNSTQSTTLSLAIPNYSSIGGYTSGDNYPVDTLSVAAGASCTTSFGAVIASGASTPSDGTVLNFAIRDTFRGTGVSRPVVVRSTGAPALKMSSTGGTVAKGGAFSYTLTYNNLGSTAILGASLTLDLPVGATFVSADAGGTVVGDKVVWLLGDTPPGTLFKVKADFTADETSKGPLLMDARLLNASDDLLARASDSKTVQDTPLFTYTITPQVDT